MCKPAIAARWRAVDAGADFLEVGIPFSDPLPAGPTIQQAVHTALAGGMTVAGARALVRRPTTAVRRART